MAAQEPPPDGQATLCSLPPDSLALVMQRLAISDVQNCLLVSKALKEAVLDERVWHCLCQTNWGPCTELHRWVVPPKETGAATPLRYRGMQPPSTYRALYYLLLRSAPIIGLWRLVGEGPVGALIAFTWTQEAIKGEELTFDSLGDEMDCTTYRTLCPRRGVLNVRLEVVDEEHAVVKDVGGSQRGLGIHRSPSAEAAASVALGQSPGNVDMLGSSPQGSFEYEWLTFMSANVATSRSKQRRKPAKSPGGPGATPGSSVHHLKRVPRPLPTHKHPLVGLWAAECGGADIEVLRILYDFSGTSARIVAVKVTGNRDVPAGQQAWVALAAPIPPPWRPVDQEAVALFQARWSEVERAGSELQEWMLDEEEDEEEDGGLGPGAGGGVNGWPGQRGAQVVAIHQASMQLAAAEPGGAGGRWAEGRLWVLSTGALAFVLEDELFSMRRIDADIDAIFAPPPPQQQQQQEQQQQRRQQVAAQQQQQPVQW